VDSVSGPFDEEENDELDIPEPPARKRGGRVAIALASIVSLGAVGVAYGVASGRLDLREAMARVDLEVSPAADEGAGGAVSPPLEAEPERAAEPQVSPTPTEPAAEDAEDPQNAEVAGDPPEGSEPSKEEADPPEEEPVSPSSTAGSRHKRQVKGRDKAKEPDEKEEPAASDDESSIPKISKQQGGSAADLIAQAAEAKRAGNRAEAIELYEQALEKDPRNTIALTALSDMAFDRGRFSEAAEYAQRAVNAAPGNGLLRIKLGDAYLKLKQYDKARAEYQKAADLGNSKAEQRLEKVKGK
jgi:tetratricopeptide (TPR) repeat protein